MQTEISEKNLHRLLPNRVPKPIVVDEIDSTNACLKQMALSGAAEGTAIFAGLQTAGRGRLGRDFASPPGGIYASVLWRLRPDDRLLCLTALAAVAVRRALARACGIETAIKWRNDLLLGEKKLCGILTELQTDGQGIQAVIGIGINVNTQKFPPELSGKATSILLQTGCAVDGNRIAAELLRELDAARSVLSENPEKYLAEYAAACITVGKRVKVLRADTSRDALALGIGHDGALRVRYNDGSEELLLSGEAGVRAQNGDYC